MPYNGSGVYTFPGAGGYPYQFNTVIDQGAVNALLGDVQSALNTAATRDGQAVWTGSLNMGNNSITNVKSLAALPAVGQTAASITFNNANPNTNSGQATFGIDASGVYVNSSILGSGTQLPIQLRQAGTTLWSIATTGALSNTAPSSGIAATINDTLGTPLTCSSNINNTTQVVIKNINAGTAAAASIALQGQTGTLSLTGQGSGAGVAADISTTGVGALRITAGDAAASLILESGGFNQRLVINSTGNITANAPSSGGHSIAGTNTNDNAAAGFVGEYVTATNSAGSAMTTGTTLNVTSISLTAGDWDVGGSVEANFTGNNTGVEGATTTTSATMPAQYLTFTLGFGQANAAANESFAVPQQRYSLSATTTVFLVSVAFFTTGTATAFGVIWARRRR